MRGWTEGLLMWAEGQALRAGGRLRSFNFNESHRPPALTGHQHSDNHDTEMAFRTVHFTHLHSQGRVLLCYLTCISM